MIDELLAPALQAVPLRAGAGLSAAAFQQIRQRLILDSCKWDPQVGDVTTLGTFPLLLSQAQWQKLSSLAYRLSAELIAAEQELIERSELHRELGLPRGIRSILRQVRWQGVTPAAARIMRFDFHWTVDGWQISEVNSDVPGGYCEASSFPQLVAEYYPGCTPAGNPGLAFAQALAKQAAEKPIALLAAAGFLEDQQVVGYLAQLLKRLDVRALFALPQELSWQDGNAYSRIRPQLGPLGAIVRFFQAEWLNAGRCAQLFVGGHTPVANSGTAILTETKRFPVVWDRLSTSLPTWRKLLPTTADLRDVDWLNDETWILKAAMCNTGDSVAIRSILNHRQWRSVVRAVRKHPERWIAQRRFVCPSIQSPIGPIYPCIGVYTINSQAAGIYGRYAHRPLIDYSAVDVAVLIEHD